MSRGVGPVHELLRRSPGLRNGLVDHAGSWMLVGQGVLNLYGPIDLADARQIAGNPQVVQIQFAGAFDVTPAVLRLLDDEVLTRHPEAAVRTTLNGHGAFDDLGFLRHLPRLRSLEVNGAALDLQPLVEHAAISHLGVGGPGTSLRPLRGYASLRTLFFHDGVDDLETIGTMHNLEGLTIGGTSPRSLAFLEPLPRLASLAFSLVAPKRFEDLCALPALEEVSIWRAKKLETTALEPLNRIARLRRLALRELPHVTSFEWLHNPSLQVVELDGLEGVRSYASLANLPALRTLILEAQVTAAQLAELAALPRLEAVHVSQSYLPALRSAFATAPLPFALVAI